MESAGQRTPTRNSPCPCGSGKRYKHCHGRLQRPGVERGSEEQLRNDLRLIEAREMLRRRHQGYGRPIVTLVVGGARIVACGKRLVSSPTWLFFPDFLIENLKDVLGRQWGASASKVMPDHPIFRWLRLLQDARSRQPLPASLPMTGGLSALNRLAYALYLIEHNDKPPKSLIKRLRRPSEFLPACQEALVASAFALAGAAIEGAEEVKSRGSKPEFFASFAAGPKYAVEAKRKSDWKAPCDPDNADFVLELRAWLRHRLYSASVKKLSNPVFWFELGISHGLTEEKGEKIGNVITEAVRDSESLTIDGEPVRSAYVVVTNNADFADDHSPAGLQFGLLMGFAMPDFRGGKLDLETAMQRHDKHRPIRRVVECLVEVQQVPNSFDNVPDELLDDSGRPIDPPKIGSRIEYPGQDGSIRTGVIEEITSAWNGTAMAAVCGDEDGERVVISIPLTPQEVKAAKKLGDAVFGKPEGPRSEGTSDPLKLYDRMLEIYRDYPQESLLLHLERHPQADEFRNMPLADLRVRTAREMTKTIVYASERDEKKDLGG